MVFSTQRKAHGTTIGLVRYVDAKSGQSQKGLQRAVISRIQGGGVVDSIRRFIEKHRYVRWKEILIGYAILCLLSGVASAWGSRHFLSSFFLWSLTHALYLPFLFFCLGFSYFAGAYAGRISRLVAVGWIVGIAALLIVTWTIPDLIGKIPGIGWRFLSVLSSQHADY